MTAQDNAALARAFNEAYNKRDWNAAVALTTAGVHIANVATGQIFDGPDGVRQFLGGWADAFPDSAVDTPTVIADEHGAAIEFMGRGTQTGPLQGPAGAIPPTGRRVEVPFAQVLEIQHGKIAGGAPLF
jgi:predicted ester cyclase